LGGHLKTQLAEQANELAAAEGRLAALRRDHDQLDLSWQAVNTNLAVIAYFRGLRDNWKRATRQNDEAGADRVGNRHEHDRHGANRG
jgi:hypothetical protein